MMPIAIMCDLRTRIARYHFTDPDRMLTGEQALACGLINTEELKELEQEAKALGMEVAQ